MTTLSLLDPVRAYEDHATLDRLSDGRLELMIGKGNGTALAFHKQQGVDPVFATLEDFVERSSALVGSPQSRIAPVLRREIPDPSFPAPSLPDL